jgi:hypothetical protein
LGFAIGSWVHRDGFLGGAPTPLPPQPGPLAGDTSVHQRVSAHSDRPFPGESDGGIIDAEYRVVP